MIPFVIARLILGAVALMAAALKSYQLATEPVDGGSLLSSRWFLVLVVEGEFAMAAWLLTGFAPSALRLVAPVVFCALGGVALAKAWTAEASCGCLGRWTMSPWAAMAFDAGAVAAMYGTSRRNSTVDYGGARRWPVAAAGALMVILAIPAGVAMARYEPARLEKDGRITGVGRHVVLEPHHWVGRRFPLLEHLEIACDLETARWIVVLVQPDCRLCQEAATQYRRIAAQLAGRSHAPRLALISVPEERASESSSNEELTTVSGHLSAQFVWHVTTPVEIALGDGIVMRVRTRASPRVEDFANL